MKSVVRWTLLAFVTASLLTLVVKEVLHPGSATGRGAMSPPGPPPASAVRSTSEAPPAPASAPVRSTESSPGGAHSKAPSPAPPASASYPSGGGKVVVYYFYTTIRCPTCRRIEALTEEALRAAFSQAMGQGLLEWRPVNVQLPQYRHFIHDYQLYAKSVIVARFQADRQVEWKNLTKVWELAWDSPAFVRYVQGEVREYLRRL